MKHVSKRLVSMLLVLCMVLSVLLLSVFAAPGQTLKVAFRYRIVPAGGGSWSGEAGRSEEYVIQVDADGAFELALPAGFEEVFPNAEFRGRLSNKLFDGWTGVGPTVAYDADTKTARVTGCTDVLDETKPYLIDVVYNEQFYKVSFDDDIRENLTWNDIVKIPAVPASGDVNRWGLGWTANGRQYLAGGEIRVSELFAGMPRGTTELELEPAYLDLTDRHIVLWTDGLSTVVRELKPNADGLYTFRMPDADVTIVAKAEKSRFSIFADPAEHSRIDAPNYANAGESVPVVVSVDPGYVLHAVLGLTGNDQMIPLTLVLQEDGSCGYLFTMPAADVTLQTVTVKAAHTVTFLDADNTLLAIVPVDHDELLDAALVPQVEKTGYEFSGWEILPVNGKTFDPANDAVAESLIVRATYEGLPFTVEAGHVDNIKYLKASSGANSSDLLEGDKLTAKAGADVLVRFAAERAMFVTVLCRMANVDTSKYMGLAFSDLEAGMYYVPYVKWANENGIVLGRSDTIFDPEASITREEMAAIMYRYCAYIGMDMTPKNTMFMERYTDRNEISDWAVTYVEWAVGCGLMRGMTDHTIDPLEHASRAQVAQVIMNFCDKVLYR